MGPIGFTSFISPISHISPTILVVRQAWEAMRILARMLSRLVFFLLLLLTVIFKSPPVALALGLGFGLSFSNPYAKQTRSLSKMLLQASVVGLGFGMNLQDVLRAGSSGFVYTALGIAATMLAGVALGRLLKVEAVSALLIFPFIGHRFALNEQQFGLWAALAIHDTSSVVGAAAKYGAAALAIGTTVKLARALWI